MHDLSPTSGLSGNRRLPLLLGLLGAAALSGLCSPSTAGSPPPSASAFTWTSTAPLPPNYRNSFVLHTVAIDPQGAVIAAGNGGRGNTSHGESLVAKWSPAGKLRWTRSLGSLPQPEVVAARTDRQGNVLAAATSVAKVQNYTVVAKWSPEGTLLWLRWLRGLVPWRADADAADLAVEPNGDAVVVSDVVAGSSHRILAARLSGSDGHLLWYRLLPASDHSDFMQTGSLHLDNLGEVEFGAPGGPPLYQPQVWKLDGATGRTRWTAQVGMPHQGENVGSLTTSASGDVYVAGRPVDPFSGSAGFVSRLDGGTGAVVWTHDFGNDKVVVAGWLAVQPDSGVIVPTMPPMALVPPPGPPALPGPAGLVRLSAGTGEVEWSQPLVTGTTDPYSIAGPVVTDSSGTIYASGMGITSYASGMFLASFASDGTPLGVRSVDAGGANFASDVPRAASMDERGNVAVAGLGAGAPGSSLILTAYLANTAGE